MDYQPQTDKEVVRRGYEIVRQSCTYRVIHFTSHTRNQYPGEDMKETTFYLGDHTVSYAPNSVT